jgi:cytochrome c peroxidase
MRRIPLITVPLVLAASSPAPSQPALHLSPPLGLDAFYPTPADNPLTRAKIALGRRLFFDTRLSVDRTRACASCHQSGHAFSDTSQVSRGVRNEATARNAPSLLNRAYGASFFWDGRTHSLEETVLEPIRNPREMGLSLSVVAARLGVDRSYHRAFATSFADGITETNIARSLASYVRSLRSGDAPFDRYVSGDRDALSLEARRGLELFRGRANCTSCHAGPNFTDEQFHNTGVSVGLDPGRAAITGRVDDTGKFKTPSLRNAALTAPYMHDGSLSSLDSVIAFYDRGGTPNPRIDGEIRPLRLTLAERNALVAFLRSLTGTNAPESGIP